jgi:methionyl-tRNA formyltransferase
MRVVLLTHGGADLVIEKLAGLEGVELAGVMIEAPRARPRTLYERLRRSIKYDGSIATAGKVLKGFRSAASTAASETDSTRTAASKAGVRVVEVEDYHSDDSIRLLREFRPDLAVVYGTNIIKESVFSIPKLGSINLHQGLAPHYRGGPPVFWELFNGEKEVGLTVHFIEQKVDTGDIILQETVPLAYARTFGVDFERFIDKFRSGLRERSARLIGDAVSMIASGSFVRTPQDLSIGKRYRLPTKKEKDELRKRLRSRLAEDAD